MCTAGVCMRPHWRRAQRWIPNTVDSCIIILYYLLKDHLKSGCMMASRKWNESNMRGVFKMGRREFDWRMIKATLPVSPLLFLLDSPLPSAPFPHKYSTKRKRSHSLCLSSSPRVCSHLTCPETHTHPQSEKRCWKHAGQNSPSNSLHPPALLLSLPFHSLTPSHPAPIILPPSAAPWTPLPLLSFLSPAAGTTTALWMHRWFCRSLIPTPIPAHFSRLSTPSKLL